jgi:hypothetical protein
LAVFFVPESAELFCHDPSVWSEPVWIKGIGCSGTFRWRVGEIDE